MFYDAEGKCIKHVLTEAYLCRQRQRQNGDYNEKIV